MKKFRTVVSLVVMLLAGVVGFFIGSTLEMLSAVQFSFR